ncbi:MarR family winged helix-turn-helix transcriptional regulator [Mycolicibacterium litorale]|uniref:MarR family winged helix-turn-helix transcriptional regulator n=1 Tax=Mycolicibacterium litorale TaxID=758802 RepID=UPI003CEF3722
MGGSDAEAMVGYLVKRVQQSLRRRCDAALRPTGLSMAQYAALRALADHPDASASELARLCFVTRQSFQDLLSGLRSAGLVGEGDARSAGRARPLALTAAGRRRLATAHTAVAGVEASMLSGLSANAKRQLAQALTACAVNLEED